MKNTRLLVVGGTPLMTWVVRRLVPAGVEVVHAGTLDEVASCIRERPPQAALFNVNPSSRPWSRVYELCRQHDPPIPSLFHPCTYVGPSEVGLPDGEPDECTTPLPACELRDKIARLLQSAEIGEKSPEIGERDAGGVVVPPCPVLA